MTIHVLKESSAHAELVTINGDTFVRMPLDDPYSTVEWAYIPIGDAYGLGERLKDLEYQHEVGAVA